MLVSADGTAFVADFGLSHALAPTTALPATTGGAKGSLRWMAPELLDGSFDGMPFTKEADIWAFGMTLYVSVVAARSLLWQVINN